MRVFRAAVQPPASPLPVDRAKIPQGSTIGSQFVRHDDCRASMLARRFSEEFQGSPLVSSLGDEALQHLALVIDSPPKIVSLAVDLHEEFIHVPAPVREGTQVVDALAADLGCEHRAGPVSPDTNRFVADINASFVQ